MIEEELFHRALELPTPAEQAAFLDQACADQPELRQRVECLLRSHRHEDSFLQAEPTATIDAPATAGLVIAGRYKLLEEIGEGGMGTVWMAEQTEPVQRRVAIKLIKPGMDSKQVVARFEAERQALALMDHPNIAKVHDGGLTEAGRPFFVMELVKGTPISKYCDEKKLQVRQRLELFADVCRAIQHAHQKGIIHRDLKPSNVLVAPFDGKPVVKVIDFGVAKATGQKLTEATLFTAFGAVVGTPEYMSPEQAELNNQDVDTRSDIYSLGVLLYELLTGTTPLTKRRVKEAAFLEVLRVIREEEAPRPSTRLSTTEELPSIAAVRGVEPAKLSKLVRGELDWIVMKALEKDRNRRYETANGFSIDVQRYLADEPVQACPPSTWYRVRKFASRNRRALISSAVFGLVFLLTAGAAAGTIGWALRDREARRTVTVARCDQLLQESEIAYRTGRLMKATAAARKAQELVESNDGQFELRNRVRRWLADLEMAARLEDLRDQWNDPHTPQRPDYSAAFRTYGIDFDVLSPAEAIARIAECPIRVDLAVALDAWARYDAARAPRLRAVAEAADHDPLRARVRELANQPDPGPLRHLAESVDAVAVPVPVLDLIGQRLWDAGAQAEAIAFLRRVQLHHPADYRINLALGHASFGAGVGRSLDDAIRHYTAAIAVRPDAGVAWYFLGRSLFLKGSVDESIAVYRRLIAVNPRYPLAHSKLAKLLSMRGQPDEAIAVARACPPTPASAAADAELLAGLLNDRAWQLAEHPDPRGRNPDRAVALASEAVALQPAAGDYWETLGVARYRAGDLRAAADALEKWAQLRPPGNGVGTFVLAIAHWQLGHKELARKLYDQAVAWMDKTRSKNEELRRFRAEAKELLGNQKKKD